MKLANEEVEIAAQHGLNLDPLFAKQHVINVVHNTIAGHFPQLGFSLAIRNEILYVHWETKTGFHERAFEDLSKESLYELTTAIRESL